MEANGAVEDSLESHYEPPHQLGIDRGNRSGLYVSDYAYAYHVGQGHTHDTDGAM